MTTTQIRTRTTTAPTTSTGARRSVWKQGVAASVAATAATTAIAALACADGVSFATEPGGPGIPALGFAQLTLVFSLIGVAIAAVMARKARRPQRTFVRTAVALTVLSVVPDLTFGFDTASAVCLITAHTVAAAIVVPTLAARLARTR